METKKHEYIIFEPEAQAQPMSYILESKIGLVCCAYYQPVRFAAVEFNNRARDEGGAVILLTGTKVIQEVGLLASFQQLSTL